MRCEITSLFHCVFQELPDCFGQVSYDVKMEADLILTDHSYNIHRKLGFQPSDYDLFSENKVSKTVEVRGYYLM